jgi:hypothetical protein
MVKERKMVKRGFLGVMTAALLAGALVLSCEFDGEGARPEKSIYIYNVNDPIFKGDCFIDVVRHAQWKPEVIPGVMVATTRKAGKPDKFINGKIGPVALLDVEKSLPDFDNPVPWTGEGEYFVVINSLGYAHRITKYKQPFYNKTLELNYPRADFVEPLQVVIPNWDPTKLEGEKPYYFMLDLLAPQGDLQEGVGISDNSLIAFTEIPSQMVLGGDDEYPAAYYCEGTYFVSREDDGTLYIFNGDNSYVIHFVQTNADGKELKRWKYGHSKKLTDFDLCEIDGSTEWYLVD